jgi:hypothetical protein
MRGYGYTSDGHVDEREAAVVRKIAEMLIAGEGIRKTARWLNLSNQPTVLGRHWEGVTVRRMLRQERLRMPNRYGEPPILPSDVAAQVLAVLDHPSRHKQRLPRRYLLTGGIAFCGLCGERLTSHRGHGDERAYTCRSGADATGCGRIRVVAEPFEDEVVALALARLTLSREKLAVALATQVENRQKWAAEVERIEKKLADLGSDYANDLIDRFQLRAAHDVLWRRRTDAMGMASDATRLDVARGLLEDNPTLSVKALREWWNRARIEDQRDVVLLVIERVTVNPSIGKGVRRFNPERIQVTWRS